MLCFVSCMLCFVWCVSWVLYIITYIYIYMCVIYALWWVWIQCTLWRRKCGTPLCRGWAGLSIEASLLHALTPSATKGPKSPHRLVKYLYIKKVYIYIHAHIYIYSVAQAAPCLVFHNVGLKYACPNTDKSTVRVCFTKLFCSPPESGGAWNINAHIG
jgi:hypothetical protein